MILTFTAVGVAQPKGSTRAFVPKGWKRPIVTSDNPKNKGWQQLVAEAASVALTSNQTGDEMWLLAHGPMRLDVTFYLPRPKSIKDKVVPHIKKPDLDKLTRSCKDALKNVVWQDDSQVVELVARKFYAEPHGGVPRAVISVSPSDATATDPKGQALTRRQHRSARPGVGDPGTPFPPVRLQDGLAPEWTCPACGGDCLFCSCTAEEMEEAIDAHRKHHRG